MKTNQDGLNLIKSFEGCRLQSYQDIKGIWTIGYGATGPDIIQGLSWTQGQADARLASDLGTFENGVSRNVLVSLNENQFSALVSFSYNLGLGTLHGSTLLAKLNAGDYNGASEQFLVWDHSGGVVVPGLLRRRQAEQALFNKSANGNGSDLLPPVPSEQDIEIKLEDIENQ